MFSTVTQSNHILFTSTKIGQDRRIRTGPAVEISNFKKSKMVDDRHLEKSKI